MPQQAPHFVDALLADRVSSRRRASTRRSTPDCSGCVERQIQRHLKQFGDGGIRNAASLLVDTRDMSVKAWVGSADYWNDAIDGQVNGVLAKRSPGSTLKPFVYALALDQGVLHPQTMLRDAPTSFGPFTPENFDGRFFGPISAEEALIRSRNVPAVWVVDAAEAAEPVSVPAERRRARHEARIVLRPGAGARRRRSHDGRARRPLRDARQSGRAAAAARRAVEPRARKACGC